jgi:hypothetical protein
MQSLARPADDTPASKFDVMMRVYDALFQSIMKDAERGDPRAKAYILAAYRTVKEGSA